MKSTSTYSLLIALLSAAGLFTANAGPQAPAKSKVPEKAPVAVVDTNAFRAVFDMPANPQEGRDPFYPQSMRPYANPVQPANVTNAAPATLADGVLKLKALSGTPEHRLALINNHTFDAGEEAAVSTDRGRLTIRCVVINTDSVVVQVGSERRELRLRGVL